MAIIDNQPTSPQLVKVGGTLSFLMNTREEELTKIEMLRNGTVFDPGTDLYVGSMNISPAHIWEYNMIYTHTNAQESDSFRYQFQLTGVSAITKSNDVYAIIANTHLKQIAEEIRLLILSMRITGGYNFDWLSANEMDNALVQYWPSPVIRYKTEGSSGSKVMDLYGMANAEFVIEIQPNVMIPNEPHPILAADAYYDQCVADLRRLFYGTPPATPYGYLALSGGSVITYKDKVVEDFAAGDQSRPGKLTTRWNVFYHYGDC